MWSQHPSNPDWSRKSKSAGYPTVFCKDHPRAWSTGHIHEHIVVKEMSLGRFLLPNEIVHHKNEIRTDNTPENLEVMTNGQHTRQHNLGKGVGVVTMTCDNCGKEFTRRWGQRAEVKGYKRAFCGRRCGGLASSARRYSKRVVGGSNPSSRTNRS